MDNGLIFPYRRRTAQANPVMLSVLAITPLPSGGIVVGSTRPYAGAVSVLTGVTQEGSPCQAMVVLVQACSPTLRQIRES